MDICHRIFLCASFFVPRCFPTVGHTPGQSEKQTHRQKRTEKVLITTVFPNCVSIHVTFWPQVGQARQKVLGQAYAYIAYIQYNMTLKFPHQVTRDSTFQ